MNGCSNFTISISTSVNISIPSSNENKKMHY